MIITTRSKAKYNGFFQATGSPCSTCSTLESKVYESWGNGKATYRNRKCVNGHRFTTIEVAASHHMFGIKPDGTRVKFKDQT